MCTITHLGLNGLYVVDNKFFWSAAEPRYLRIISVLQGIRGDEYISLQLISHSTTSSHTNIEQERQSAAMYLTKATLLFALGALFASVSAQSAGVCNAPQCDDSNYLCGVCDPEDPQICTVGGTQLTCKQDVETGKGGGVSRATYWLP